MKKYPCERCGIIIEHRGRCLPCNYFYKHKRYYFGLKESVEYDREHGIDPKFVRLLIENYNQANVLRYAEQLVRAEIHDPKNIEVVNTVPKKIGVYLWRSKGNNEIVYVGRALGEEGLYQRIIRQHLSNSYTKSVFRKQIAKEYGLNLKEESASFIKDNFVFSFISFKRDDENMASWVETLLIKEYLPKYNRSGKY